MPRGRRTATPLFSPSGACAHAAGMIAANSAAASDTVRFGASRPIIVSVVQSAASESLHHRYPTRSIIVGMYRFNRHGCQATGCGGATPITVKAAPLIVIVEPSGRGRVVEPDRQKSYPITATRSRSGTWSSSASKEPAERGLHAEQREVIRRDHRAIDFLRIAADGDEERRGRIVRGKRAHGCRAFAECDVIGIRNGAVSSRTAARRGNGDELPASCDRQSPPEQGVGQASPRSRSPPSTNATVAPAVTANIGPRRIIRDP